MSDIRQEAKWALDSFDAETGKRDWHATELAYHLRALLAEQGAGGAEDRPAQVYAETVAMRLNRVREQCVNFSQWDNDSALAGSILEILDEPVLAPPPAPHVAMCGDPDCIGCATAPPAPPKAEPDGAGAVEPDEASLSAEGFAKLSDEIMAIRAARVGAVPLDGPTRFGECGICRYAPCLCATPLPTPAPAGFGRTPAVASAARKAAEATARYLLSVADETTLGTFEEELVECIRALLAEAPEAGARFVRVEHPSPSTWVLPEDDERHAPPPAGDEVYTDPATGDEYVNGRCVGKPAGDEVREALAEIVEWAASEGPCSCNVDSPVQCWLCRWHGRATAALAARPAVAESDEVREAALTRDDAMTLIGHAEYLRRVHGEEDMPRFFDGLARRLLAALAARGGGR